MADAMPPPSQNKCFRYWPELHGSQEYGRLRVCNVAEHQAQGYCVRELQVWRADQVSLEGNETCGARVSAVGKSPGLRWGEEALGWPCLHPTPLALVASTSLNPVGTVLAWALLGSVPSRARSQPQLPGSRVASHPHAPLPPVLPWAVSAPSASFVC